MATESRRVTAANPHNRRSARLPMQTRVQQLEAELRIERKARQHAEDQARRFHALLIKERIQHLPKRAA